MTGSHDGDDPSAALRKGRIPVRAAIVIPVFSVLCAANAHALPATPKVVVSGSETIKPSAKFTAAEAKRRNQAFDPAKTYKTQSGKSITGQQFLDFSNRLQGAAEKGGCDLGSGKPCNFRHADARLDPASLNQTANLAARTLSLKQPPPPAPAEKKAKNPLGFSWNKQWGQTSTGAVYVGADLGTGGGSQSSSCGGSAYAGVYLFGVKKDVVRLDGEVASSGTTTTGSATFYVLGDAVWSKSGSFNATPLSFEKSFPVSKGFTYWGIVSINATAKVTAAASITGAISGKAKAGEFDCSMTITPGVKATASASAEVELFGYGQISAAAVGVESDLVLANLTLPLTATAKAQESGQSVSFSETLEADLNASFLKGSLDVYFRTIVPLDGEKIWDWDSDKFTFTLLEWDGIAYNQTLYKKTQTQKL
jgi:hypothetical protein